MKPVKTTLPLKYLPLTTNNWKALEQLFGEKGACGGCWCMLWRLPHQEFEENKGDGNRKLLKTIAKKNKPLGIIAMDKDTPIGWCSVSPKSSFVRLKKSRLFKENYEREDIWTISCLFLAKRYRRRGISSRLIQAAARYALSLGAKIVEAYPLTNSDKPIPDAFAWVGFEAMYRKAGFKRTSSPSATRVVMQLSS